LRKQNRSSSFRLSMRAKNVCFLLLRIRKLGFGRFYPAMTTAVNDSTVLNTWIDFFNMATTFNVFSNPLFSFATKKDSGAKALLLSEGDASFSTTINALVKFSKFVTCKLQV